MAGNPDMKTEHEGDSRQSWEPIKMTYVGDMADVVQGGGGKLSLTASDTGDIRKPRGQG